MITITISKGFSTGLLTDFDLVKTIEIDDHELARGGFGVVYTARSVNSGNCQYDYVVKLFIDNGLGSAIKNFETTNRLQTKLKEEADKLRNSSGRNLLDVFTAFKGVPQFSFTGKMQGKDITGFISLNLVSLGFVDFNEILNDQTSFAEMQRFPIEGKLILASQLISAFQYLEKINFIHADLKPGAVFINLAKTELAIIDFDSGVLVTNPDDEPMTWGAPGDWVAPEIWEQQHHSAGKFLIEVDTYSDRWSVAIGIHYLMTGYHPLFFLTELSPRVSKEYFVSQKAWPYIDKKAWYFAKENDAFYDQYLKWITTLAPGPVIKELAKSLNFGYKQPVARTNYADWEQVFLSIQHAPEVIDFSAEVPVLIKGTSCQLKWEIKHAYEVSLYPGIGLVGMTGQVSVAPQTNTTYRIEAKGFHGTASADLPITVFPVPVLHTLMVPVPDFRSKISFGDLSLTPPSIALIPRIEISSPSFILNPPDLQFKSNYPVDSLPKQKFKLSNLYAIFRKRRQFGS